MPRKGKMSWSLEKAQVSRVRQSFPPTPATAQSLACYHFTGWLCPAVHRKGGGAREEVGQVTCPHQHANVDGGC